MTRVHVRCDDDIPGLRARLEAHPGVELTVGQAGRAIEFSQAGWARTVEQGAHSGLRGLVELMDNNPLVCADRFSVPDPGSTLALVGLGPLVRAGLIVEPPAIIATFDLDANRIDGYLAEEGWTMGATYHAEHQPAGRVVALNAMALVPTPERLEDLDDLFDEAYGRSFYVRRFDDAEWDIDLVEGKPWAAYRLRVTPGSPHSLLTIQTMADRDGKVGAAQLVHAMNVMAGFEESLGVQA